MQVMTLLSWSFSGGTRGVVESSEPLSVETSPGKRAPVDLGLVGAAGGFEPKTPAVGVRIPKHLQEGVALGDMGVSLTPADASGAAVGGSEGQVDGAVVFYGGVGVGSDVDMAVKPTPLGFADETFLRSERSPETLDFTVGMPQGATLVQDRSGATRVVDAEATMAYVEVPSAVDAEGVNVPVSMKVAGNTLVLTVDLHTGSYRYPVAVDPTIIETTVPFSGLRSAWAFSTDNSTSFIDRESEIEYGSGVYKAGQYGYLVYPTQGESHIFKFHTEFTQSNILTQLALSLASPGSGPERETKIKYEEKQGTVCTRESCVSEEVTTKNDDNRAFFEVRALEEGNKGFYDHLEYPTLYITQEKGPSTHFDSTEATLGGKRNAAYGQWVNTSSSVLGLNAFDPGTGVDAVSLKSPNKSEWGRLLIEDSQNECAGAQCNECYESECPTTKAHGKPLTFAFTELTKELPEGEDTVEATVEDAAGYTAHATGKVKIDNVPPRSLSLSGLPSTVTEGDYHLKGEASDGSGSVPSSGIDSLTIYVDGREVGKPSGSCSPGPCTAKGEWTINGGEFGAGEHKLTLTATDNAGNVSTESYTFTDHHATPVSLGPGLLNPESGEMSLSATDVSVASPGSSLTVGRIYRSRHLTAGMEGPLGPQWSLSIGGQESITRLPNGNATLTSVDGGQSTFTSIGSGKFTSPPGDSNLTLTEGKNEKGELQEYILTDPATDATTRFTSLNGPTGSLWKPTKQEGPLSSQTARYIYQTTEGVTEPKYALAPEPTGLSFSCFTELEKSEKLEKGCRALEFVYASSTSAKGENKSEWGSYKGRLKEVIFMAWNPSTKEMGNIAVARYEYDGQGRLRDEWNPQVAGELKTTYGYDAEGHVTATTPPGQQPWLLHYGTTANNPSSGQLLSVVRPAASTTTGNGIAPANTSVPTLSSTKPVVGTKISVSSNGTWNNSPLTYIYQWEDCNSSGKECTPIPEAVNQSYYPTESDEGRTLVAQVSALNGTGATAAASAATSVVAYGTPNEPFPEPPSPGTNSIWTVDYRVPFSGSEIPNMGKSEVEKWGQKEAPVEGTAIFPPDEPMGWRAKEYKRATIEYFDAKGRAIDVVTPGSGVFTTEYNEFNDVIRTLSPDNRAAALKESCVSEKECKSAELAKLLSTEKTYEEKGSEPGTELLSTLAPRHTVELASGKEGKINEETLARERTNYYYNEGAPTEGGPYHLVTKTIDFAETASKEEFDKRTTETSYGGQEGLGWKLRKPTAVTTEPHGLHITHTTEYSSVTGAVTETKMPGVNENYTFSSMFGSEGSGNGQFGRPGALTVDTKGDVWVADLTNDRVEEFNSNGEYLKQVGTKGSGNGQLIFPDGVAIDSHNNIWVSDDGNNRIEEFNEKGEYVKAVGEGGGSSGLHEPSGVAFDSHGNIWVADPSEHVVKEFNEKGEYLKSVGTYGSGEGQLKEPLGLAFDSHGNLWVADWVNKKALEYNEKGEYIREIKKSGEKESGVAIDSHNDVFLIAPGTEEEEGGDDVEEFNEKGEYKTKFGVKGSGPGEFRFEEPVGLAFGSRGELWVTDSLNHRVEKWLPPSSATGNLGAHDTKTIYYTAKEEASVVACRNHPEWAGLPCETAPAAQPGTSGLPELPTTKYTYNVWNEPETNVETVGSTTRTKTNTYDEAGRLKTAAISSTVGEPLPTVTNEYNKETGALEKQSITTSGKTKTITSITNKLGQLESYTDAAEKENKTTYEYDVDGRIKKVNGEKGTETYKYGETMGLPEELVNEYGSTKLTFTATYDAEGNMLTESYPNGMTATYTYNQVDKPTSLLYKKTTHCTEEEKEKCKWFKDTVIPSIHGEWLEQTSSLSHQAYTYDNAGRLTQVQNTPVGKDCTTRIYTYDEDTNRTSLTTRESSTEKCATTESGKIQEHTYDTADRLTDPGVAYNTFGDITTLPASDAEASGAYELTSTYYTDNQVASQKQSEQTIGYNLDPAGRTLETVSTGKPNNSTIISHYTSPGNAPAWTTNAVSGEWTRNITGISGSLVAIQNNGETPELQLTNLHGDIVAKAYLSEAATELAAKADTSEYGVPTVTAPAKYSWLGASELPTELPSGVVAMGVRSYVPQIGRFLQPDPLAGGSANAYSYTFGDPVNTTDPTGEYTASIDAFDEEHVATLTAQAVALAAAEKVAAEEYAAKLAAEAALAAQEDAASNAAAETILLEDEYLAGGGGGSEYVEEWEEWEEEEGEWEYASYHSGSGTEHEEPHRESAVFTQPLGDTTEDWFRILIAVGSRCEQYGGHWSHHKCVGTRTGGGSKSACVWVAGSGGAMAGAAVGSVAGPGGSLAGSLVGGWLASKVCG
jgi:RHS repeat-associated protein